MAPLSAAALRSPWLPKLPSPVKVTVFVPTESEYQVKKVRLLRDGYLNDLAELEKKGLIFLTGKEVVAGSLRALQLGYPSEIDMYLSQVHRPEVAIWYLQWYRKNHKSYIKSFFLKESIKRLIHESSYSRLPSVRMLILEVANDWLSDGFVDDAVSVTGFSTAEIIAGLNKACKNSMLFQVADAMELLGWKYLPAQQAEILTASFLNRSDRSKQQYLFAQMTAEFCTNLSQSTLEKLISLSVQYGNLDAAMNGAGFAGRELTQNELDLIAAFWINHPNIITPAVRAIREGASTATKINFVRKAIASGWAKGEFSLIP